MKRQTSVRLSQATRQKLDRLAAQHGTATEAIAVAVDRLYREETMSEDLIYRVEVTPAADPTEPAAFALIREITRIEYIGLVENREVYQVYASGEIGRALDLVPAVVKYSLEVDVESAQAGKERTMRNTITGKAANTFDKDPEEVRPRSATGWGRKDFLTAGGQVWAAKFICPDSGADDILVVREDVYQASGLVYVPVPCCDGYVAGRFQSPAD